MGFLEVDSFGHAIPRKTYNFDIRSMVLQLRTVLRVKSSARTGHLTASRLSSSLSLILSGLPPLRALAFARLGARLAPHASRDSVDLRQSPTHDSSGDRPLALTRSAQKERTRATATLRTGLRVGQRRTSSCSRQGPARAQPIPPAPCKSRVRLTAVARPPRAARARRLAHFLHTHLDGHVALPP
jgi:hypothetical protein